MSDFVMTIGGDSVPAADSFGVINPANGEVFAHAPECTRDQLDAAFDSAAKAQRDWKLDEAARRDDAARRWPTCCSARPASSPRSSPPSRASPWPRPTSRSSPRPSGASTSPTSRRRPR